jgi:hypothetical protein
LWKSNPKKLWHFSTRMRTFSPPSIVEEGTRYDCFGGGPSFLSSFLCKIFPLVKFRICFVANWMIIWKKKNIWPKFQKIQFF